MIAALGLTTGRLHYRIRDHKRWHEFLGFLKTLRRRWPDQKLYLICDNFSPHKHPEVRTWCATNQVDLVFLPTYASWLNHTFAHTEPYSLIATGVTQDLKSDPKSSHVLGWSVLACPPRLE